jgi:hypothetical protein
VAARVWYRGVGQQLMLMLMAVDGTVGALLQLL